VRTPTSPLREIGRYGPRERAALAGLAGFRPPRDYHWQRDTAAGRFLIALREDPALRRRFAADPDAALADWPGLDARARRRLASAEAGAMQLAAKGLPTAHPGNQRLLGALFARRDLLAALRRLLTDSAPAALAGNLAAWSAARGFSANWSRMADDIALAERRRLWAWAGLYAADDGPPVIIHAIGEVSHLLIGRSRIGAVRYADGTLRWPDQRGADGVAIPAGQLRTDRDRHGRRRLIGRLPGARPTDAARQWRERVPGALHPSRLVGCWQHRDGTHRLDIDPADGPAGRVLEVRLDGRLLPGPYRCEGHLLIAAGRRFALAAEGQTAQGDWQAPEALPPAFHGDYRLSVPAPVLRLDADGLHIGGQVPDQQHLTRTALHWSGGPPGARSGALTPLLDPLSLYPALTGWIAPEAGRRIGCTGRCPPPPDLRRPDPELGLSTGQWADVLACANAGDGLDWLRWRKAAVAARCIGERLAAALAGQQSER
jgi:hypothetical protein